MATRDISRGDGSGAPRAGGKWHRPYIQMDNEEKELALTLYFKQRKTVKEVAYAMGRGEKTIRKLVNAFMGTSVAAEQYIKSRSLFLAKKVVQRATVEEAVDILSRSNIGVLAPVKATADRPQILISVNQNSIGSISSSSDGLPADGSGAKLITGGGYATRA